MVLKIGHFLSRNCCRKHDIEGKIERRGRRGRKHDIEGKIERRGRRGRKHIWLQNDLKDWRRYWNLKEKHYSTLWGTCFESGYGLVARQSATLTNNYIPEI